MDRMNKAARRLWGSLDNRQKLPASPLFTAELAAHVNGRLTLRVPAISAWSFGEQLEHLYRASHYVLDRLQEAMAAAENPELHPNLLGHVFNAAGFIPRGMFPTIPELEPRGGTLEQIEPLKASLEERAGKIDWDLPELYAHPGRSRHPRMSYLRVRQWVCFLDIHHRHHLAIMRDMLKAA